MGFEHIRLGHAVPYHKHQKRAGNPTCKTGGFISSPTIGSTFAFPGTNSLNITWDSTCLSAQNLDIYLYSFSSTSASTRIHLYNGVPNAQGSYAAPIMPRWWNATATAQLQLLIVPQDDPPFLSSLPAGPVFAATYTAPTDGSTPADADVSQNLRDTGITSFSAVSESEHKGLPAGSKAAAAIVPLLFVIILGIAYYLRRMRLKQQAQRQTFAEKVDARMSVISGDWSSTTPKGAMDAVRRSVAFDAQGNPRVSIADVRASTFSYSAPAPSNNPALAQYQSHLRPGVGGYQTAERVSRVSFAADTRKSRVSFADGSRPSVDRASRYGGVGAAGVGASGRASRAFHSAFTVDTTVADEDHPLPPAYKSPSPTSNFSHTKFIHEKNGSRSVVNQSERSSEDGSLSPTQTAGALTLSADDIRMAAQSNNEADVGPALRSEFLKTYFSSLGSPHHFSDAHW
ncbi:hypothetical protein HGRIS_012495 [Hohenbuehelia grisea]|uniref:Uncharacterized protein n=1 Tax=Hohenbuehelia grisea TaxID=104357 RepID=A0ABR3ISE9_9AGAR